MSDRRFSKPMQPPTGFETELLRRQPAGDDPWVRLGQAIGAVALCAVLDELGGLQVSVPVRREFFPRLYRPERNEAIRAALEAGVADQVIAREHEVSPGRVRQLRIKFKLLRRHPRRVTANRGT